MTATFDVLPGSTPVEEAELHTVPTKAEAALGSMVNSAFVDATELQAATTVAEPAAVPEQQPSQLEPVAEVKLKQLESYEPVDDRFTHAARNSMTPGQRSRLAAKESIHPLPEPTQPSGVMLSTWQARRIRSEARGMGILAGNNHLRRHGLK